MSVSTKAKDVLVKLKCPYVWMSAAVMAVSNPVNALAGDSEVNFDDAAKPIVSLINQMLTPLISVVAALGAIYCVLLGVKLAKADEPQEREKAKMALKNAIVGFFLIFILIVVLRILVPQLTKWVDANSSNAPAIQSK